MVCAYRTKTLMKNVIFLCKIYAYLFLNPLWNQPNILNFALHILDKFSVDNDFMVINDFIVSWSLKNVLAVNWMLSYIHLTLTILYSFWTTHLRFIKYKAKQWEKNKSAQPYSHGNVEDSFMIKLNKDDMKCLLNIWAYCLLVGA